MTWSSEISIDHIADGLHVASITEVREEPTNQYDLIVSVCQDACWENVSGDTQYIQFKLADDSESVANWGGKCDYDMFAEAAESVTQALRDDSVDNIVVHCHVGRNRSTAVSAAAIAVHRDVPFADAYAWLEANHPIANSNELMREHGRQFVSERR